MAERLVGVKREARRCARRSRRHGRATRATAVVEASSSTRCGFSSQCLNEASELCRRQRMAGDIDKTRAAQMSIPWDGHGLSFAATALTADSRLYPDAA